MAKTLKLNVNGFQFFVVAGGPYRERPRAMYGVKMAVEITDSCNVNIPTKDFNVPPLDLFTRGFEHAVDALLAGEPLYVGCMGGVGRTGLFLACLAKAFGESDPVGYVRAHYNGHAVETAQQLRYVADFKVPQTVLDKIARRKKWSFLRFWRKNLTNTPRQQEDLQAAVRSSIRA